MNFEETAKKIMDEYAREAIKTVIAENVGYGIDNDIKNAIKEKALTILNEDAEIKDMIREAIIYWIKEN